MAKKIRVENNSVVECMNADEVPAGAMDTGDWRDAVEVAPELIPNRQIRGSHWFDLTKNPVEIRWNVEDLSLEERKESVLISLTSTIRNGIREEVSKELDCSYSSDEHCCIDTLNANITLLRQKRQEISPITTHNQLDQYMIANGLL